MPVATTRRPTGSPYEAALHDAFFSLHPQVQRAHLAPLSARGSLQVEHGPHWWTKPLIKLLKLPAAGVSEPVRLEVTAERDELVWARRIGAVDLRTRQRAV